MSRISTRYRIICITAMLSVLAFLAGHYWPKVLVRAQEVGSSDEYGKRDIKKHFEAILDRALLNGEVVLRDTVGIYTRTTEGSVTSREIGTTGVSTKICNKKEVLVVGGSAQIGSDGKIEFPLSDFHCEKRQHTEFDFPVNFVATPQSRSPVFLTATQGLTADRSDVRIRVHAWDTAGKPVPNISFDWRCLVPIVDTIP